MLLKWGLTLSRVIIQSNAAQSILQSPKAYLSMTSFHMKHLPASVASKEWTHVLDVKSESMEFKTLGLYVDCFLNPNNCCVTVDSSLIGLLKEMVLEGDIPMATAATVEYLRSNNFVYGSNNFPPPSSLLSPFYPSPSLYSLPTLPSPSSSSLFFVLAEFCLMAEIGLQCSCTVQFELQLTILLPQTPECWGYRRAQLQQLLSLFHLWDCSLTVFLADLS